MEPIWFRRKLKIRNHKYVILNNIRKNTVTVQNLISKCLMILALCAGPGIPTSKLWREILSLPAKFWRHTMTTLKFVLAAALVTAASTYSFANGLTDKDPQFVYLQSLTDSFVPPPGDGAATHTGQASGQTGSQAH